MPKLRKTKYFTVMVVAVPLLLGACVLKAQMPPGALAAPSSVDGLGQKPVVSPLTQPMLSPGVILLMELEGKFAKAVAEGGGKAFASWFTDDALILNNGQPPVMGRAAIAAKAQWDPKEYQLTWVPEGAQMGPSNDMGFTWGHYEGHSRDKNGEPVRISGRYMTVWKKMADESWKVALDASANEAPAAGECCVVPKP